MPPTVILLPGDTGLMDHTYVKTRREGRVLIATLDSPPHQLMTFDLVAELDQLVAEVERDESVGAVVLHGAHPERFLAHFDVSELLESGRASRVRLSHGQASLALHAVSAAARIPGGAALVDRTPATGMLGLERFHDLMLRIGRVGVTFIAAIDGSSLGGGCELSLACDLRFMADGDFVIGQPEILLGIIPGGGGSQRLTRLVGTGKAIELVLEGTALDPGEALEIGLVHRVVAPERLLDEAIETAQRLARRPRVAVAAAKRAVYEGGSMDLPSGLHVERAAFMQTLTSAAAERGMQAYVDGFAATGELPAYDLPAREALLDGSYVDLTQD